MTAQHLCRKHAEVARVEAEEYAEIPSLIVSHIARCAGCSGVPEGMVASDASTAPHRHMALVRAFIDVMAYGHAARQIMVEARLEAARTRDGLADIIYYRKVVSDGVCANVAYTPVWGLGTPPPAPLSPTTWWAPTQHHFQVSWRPAGA